MCGNQEKSTRHQKAKNTIRRDRASIRTRHGRNVRLSDKEFKTTVIYILRALIDKEDSMQEQMGNVSRKREILRRSISC